MVLSITMRMRERLLQQDIQVAELVWVCRIIFLVGLDHYDNILALLGSVWVITVIFWLGLGHYDNNLAQIGTLR